jgi:hypothetical protein
MQRFHDETTHLDSKTRRKLEDQRRMQFRRAIEDRCEQRRLQLEMSDYPELIAANYLLSTKAARQKSGAKVR